MSRSRLVSSKRSNAETTNNCVHISGKSIRNRDEALKMFEALIDSKLGDPEAFGEATVRLKFRHGQLSGATVTDCSEIK